MIAPASDLRLDDPRTDGAAPSVRNDADAVNAAISSLTAAVAKLKAGADALPDIDVALRHLRGSVAR